MKTRRHHNNKGYRQIRRGACANEVKRIARKYGLRYVERLKRRDTGEITMQQTQRQLPLEIQAKIARNAAARERRKTALPSVDNIDPADQRIEIAKTIAVKSSNSLVVRYIRAEPSLAKIIDPATGRADYEFMRGEPLATMVAFKHGGKTYFGWSKRHPSDEPLMFTKDRARFAAVLRGLTDGITFAGKTSVTNSAGKYLPGIIAKNIPAFLAQANKYFDTDFVNVSV